MTIVKYEKTAMNTHANPGKKLYLSDYPETDYFEHLFLQKLF